MITQITGVSAGYLYKLFSKNGDLFFLTIVGALWGCTNPLIKYGSKEITNIKGTNVIFTLVLQLKFMLINWKCMLPLVLNQFGSLLYFYALQRCSLSLVVPVANSLTFAFTALAGYYFEEEKLSRKSLSGILLIVLGVMCFVGNKSGEIK